MSRLIRAVIDAGALRQNLRKIRERARGARVMAVVKANAYGHGLVPTALALAEVDAFAVARLEEGLALRAQGVTQPIVLLEGVFAAEQLLEAARYGFDLVVHDALQIEILEEDPGPHRFVLWVKIDTGMNRLGFRPSEFPAALERRGLEIAQALEGCRELAWPKAEAVHAGVDFDPEHEAMRTGIFLQDLDLQGVVHDEIEAVPRGLEELFRREHAFEEHDRLGHALGAQREALLQPRHREGIDLRQRQRRGHEPVPVCVRLHDRHDPGATRALADRPDIVPQRPGVDHRPDEAAHLSTPSA